MATISEIEKLVLSWPEKERAQLASTILQSLPRNEGEDLSKASLPEEAPATAPTLGQMTLRELVGEAAKLPEGDQASLACQLLHQLKSPIYSVSDKEVRKRIEEADADPSILISLDELVTGLRHRGT